MRPCFLSSAGLPNRCHLLQYVPERLAQFEEAANGYHRLHGLHSCPLQMLSCSQCSRSSLRLFRTEELCQHYILITMTASMHCRHCKGRTSRSRGPDLFRRALPGLLHFLDSYTMVEVAHKLARKLTRRMRPGRPAAPAHSNAAAAHCRAAWPACYSTGAAAAALGSRSQLTR